jgi:hypothetical protein
MLYVPARKSGSNPNVVVFLLRWAELELFVLKAASLARRILSLRPKSQAVGGLLLAASMVTAPC